MFRILFCHFCFFVCIQSVLTQSYNYRNFAPKEGLPSTEVYHVFQDSKGYMWFSTDNGVSRYDGYDIKTFSSDDGLPDNTIFEIYEDWKGRIWFISFSVKLSYLSNDSIYSYPYNNAIEKLLNHYTVLNKSSFYVDRNNTVYFSDRFNGIIKIDSSGIAELLSEKYFIIFQDSVPLMNKYLKNTQDSLYVFWNNRELSIKPEFPKKGLHKKTALKWNNFLYFSANNKLFKYSQDGLMQSREFDEEIIWLSASHQQVWVGTTQGVFCFNNGDLYSQPKYKLLLNNSISSVLTDHEGGFWLTTLEDGVFYLPWLNVTSIQTSTNDNSAPRITSLHEFDNKIWYGTFSGEFGMLSKGKLNPLFQASGVKTCLPVYDIINNDQRDYIILTVCDTYFLSNKTLNDSSKNKHRLKNAQVNTGGRNIIELAEKEYYVVNRSGINYYKGETGENLIRYIIPKSVSSHSALLLDEEKILIGTSDGLWEFYIKTKKFKPLNIHQKLKDRIICLKQDKNGVVWVGTKRNGVLGLKNNKVVCILDKYGLESNFINALFPYENSVWVATKGGGAYKVSFSDTSFKDLKIQKWSTNDGILSIEINDIVVNDTAAFFATNKGLNIIKYKEYDITAQPPFLYVKSIKINNKDTVLQNRYVLKYNQNSVDITLTGLSYRYPGKITYQYRIKNEQKKNFWSTTNNRNISLVNLSPGKYLFEAKALNGKVESIENITIEIIILPPFWKTWWFNTLVSIVVILIISFIIRRRLVEIEKRNNLEKQFLINKNKLQREIEKYRQQALTQQMNPHFIFNSLNSIQLFVYQENKNLSTKYLSKFSRLIRIILENSQHQEIPFQKEFEALTLYLELEEMRLQGKMSFTIDIDKNINTSFYKIPPLLFQPFVENAIWHGIVHKKGKGCIKIILKEQNDVFLCLIEDDGVGREKAIELRNKKTNLHKSMGIEITQKRLELLNNRFGNKMSIIYTDLWEKDIAAGTRVELKIPKLTHEN